MHTHSHYLLFLIGLRHCRKLVPKICQPASQPTDVSERKPGQHYQVHFFGSRRQVSRSVSAVCSWQLHQGKTVPQHWPKFLPSVHFPWQAWPASSPNSHGSSVRSRCCSHLPSPRRALWALPKPRLQWAPGCLWVSLTPLAPGPGPALHQNRSGTRLKTPKPMGRVPELRTRVQAHFSSLCHISLTSNFHTVFHGPSEKDSRHPHRAPDGKNWNDSEKLHEQNLLFFPDI